jgi:hypothetical protein
MTSRKQSAKDILLSKLWYNPARFSDYLLFAIAMPNSAAIQADISTIENLQHHAHNQMGLSGMAVFNDGARPVQNSENVRGIMSRIPKFKMHWDAIQRGAEEIKKLQSEKMARPANAASYDSLIPKHQARVLERRDFLATEAKNITALIGMERLRLGFDYKPGTTVSREGIDANTFAERKTFADAVNAFHSGKLPDGTPFTAFLK